MSCKLFADVERIRVKEAEKKAEDKYIEDRFFSVAITMYINYRIINLACFFFESRKRRAVEKDKDESETKIKKEWDKNYEVRVLISDFCCNFFVKFDYYKTMALPLGK
jgi:hypothetical protein